ncbi:MAG: DUF3501 family protein [Xanthobacteraceae bacterium]|nr:MAG: DUF3501 family protein [Xanthobacteraceae bacterium]
MPASNRRISAADIIEIDRFAAERTERRQALLPVKKLRRVDVGPVCTFYFESFDTLLFQIHEMLHIERGGEVQLVDELHAYGPLVPQGDELVATVMFEVDDPVRRQALLLRLTHIEQHIFIQIGDRKIYCVPEEDVDRTSADGKTSSVHFVRFPIPRELQRAFRDPKVGIMVGADHENYAHLAVLSPATRAELARDFAAA